MYIYAILIKVQCFFFLFHHFSDFHLTSSNTHQFSCSLTEKSESWTISTTLKLNWDESEQLLSVSREIEVIISFESEICRIQSQDQTCLISYWMNHEMKLKEQLLKENRCVICQENDEKCWVYFCNERTQVFKSENFCAYCQVTACKDSCSVFKCKHKQSSEDSSFQLFKKLNKDSSSSFSEDSVISAWICEAIFL